MKRFRALIDWLVERSPSGPVERARTWYITSIWLVGAPLMALNGLSHLLQGLAVKAGLDACGALFGVAALTAMRRGVAPNRIAHASLGFTIAYFSLISLAMTPFSAMSLIFVAFVPLQGAIALPPRGAVFWAVVAMVCGAGALIAGEAGLVLPVSPTGSPVVEHVLNFAIAIVIASMSALFHDRSRQRAYDELADFEASRARLLAHVSHELRTPLNGIVGIAQVLKLGPVDATRVEESVSIITNQAAALRTVVDDFLDFSKLEAGKLLLFREPVELAALVHEVAALHRTVATQKGLTLNATCSLPEYLTLDAIRVRQVLNNLVANAVKFTPRGEVAITADWRDDELTLVIRDSGIGMSDDVRNRLFKAFSQGDAASARRFGGTGLGLAISLQLVEAMGGRVLVESTPAVGSQFSVMLPAPRANAPTRRTGPVVRQATRALHLLVVDDNAVNRLVAERLLKHLGHRVTLATNGASALESLASQRFDGALMDLHMPELDGPETTRRYRATEPPGHRLPIFALTASALRDELDACLAAGMDDTLTKPLRVEDLELALSRCDPRLARVG